MERKATSTHALGFGIAPDAMKWVWIVVAVLLLQSCYYHAYEHDPYDHDVYYGQETYREGTYYDHEPDYHGHVAFGYGNHGYWSGIGLFGPFGYVNYIDHHYYSRGYYYPYYGYVNHYRYRPAYYRSGRRHQSDRHARRDRSPYVRRHNPDRDGDRHSAGHRSGRRGGSYDKQPSPVSGVVGGSRSRVREDDALRRPAHDDRRGRPIRGTQLRSSQIERAAPPYSNSQREQRKRAAAAAQQRQQVISPTVGARHTLRRQSQGGAITQGGALSVKPVHDSRARGNTGRESVGQIKNAPYQKTPQSAPATRTVKPSKPPRSSDNVGKRGSKKKRQ